MPILITRLQCRAMLAYSYYRCLDHASSQPASLHTETRAVLAMGLRSMYLCALVFVAVPVGGKFSGTPTLVE